MPQRGIRIGSVVAAVLLAYVILVNLAGALPARVIGPLAKVAEAQARAGNFSLSHGTRRSFSR